MLRKPLSFAPLALAIALATIPGSLAALFAAPPLLAQSPPPTFSLPPELPSGTTVRVNGSTSMAGPNQDLKRRFEARFPGTTVNLEASSSDQAIEQLLAGEIDVAAIGRSLTPEEQQQGLTKVSIGREKIAIILGAENPFDGNLSFEQFAQIFRGQITNWSQVGGPDVPIRFIDRPDSSDTRRALGQYEVFRRQPFESGATAVQVADDETTTVTQALGNDGISYAPASQAVNQPGVRVLPMHQTLPDDPRYPYSKPRGYVYRGTPTPAVLAFLAFATAPAGQEPVAAAVATPTPATVASPIPATPTAPVATPDAVTAAPPLPGEQGAPVWLPIALLAGLAALAALLFGRGRRTPTATTPLPAASSPPDPAVAPTAPLMASPPPPAASATSPPVAPPAEPEVVNRENGVPEAAIAGAGLVGAGLAGAALAGAAIAKPKSRIILTPRDHRDAYAYWETPEAHKQNLQQQGGRDLKLRIYDVTGLDPEGTLPATYQEYAVTEADVDRHVPIAESDRDYLAEIGYTTPDRQWLPLARSSSVRVPAAPVATAIASEALSTETSAAQPLQPLIVETPALEPVFNPSVTEVPVVEMVSVQPLTAEALPEPVVEPLIVETPPTQATPPGQPPIEGIDASLALGAAALAVGTGSIRVAQGEEDEQSHVEAAKFDVGQTDLSSEQLADVDEGLSDLPDGYGESRIVLLPRDPQWAYTYWDTPNEHKLELRHQGGERLALRLFDVTGIDLNTQRPHSIQQYDCDELARDWYLPIPVSDRDYLVEIGYLAADGRWLVLARSNTIRIPPVYPSDWYEDLFLTLGWDESLAGRTFMTLIPPGQRSRVTGNLIYDEIFGLAESAESQRVAGSLFGSMQHVPGSVFGSMQMASGAALSSVPLAPVPISSYIFPSGVGMGEMLTVSGLTMSGIGVFGSMPPIRARKFWLVADAELIVYGATEPDAKVYIAGREIPLNPDGTFRFQMSFQDGLIDYPILAIAADGEQSRAIHMKFTRETPHRNTNTKAEAKDEPF